MPTTIQILIPTSLLEFDKNDGLRVSSPTNARIGMATKLLGMIQRGEKTIHENKENTKLIRWLKSDANNNILHMIWYLKDAERANPREQPKPRENLGVWGESKL
jgi:hypothetical protein